MSLKPGATLLNGQYKGLSLLGRFGFVYHARVTLIRKPVAREELPHDHTVGTHATFGSGLHLPTNGSTGIEWLLVSTSLPKPTSLPGEQVKGPEVVTPCTVGR